MPHLAKVAEVDKTGLVSLIKATLLSDYHNKGLVHEDVSRSNIGLYGTKCGGKNAVGFDMGSVRDLSVKETDT